MCAARSPGRFPADLFSVRSAAAPGSGNFSISRPTRCARGRTPLDRYFLAGRRTLRLYYHSPCHCQGHSHNSRSTSLFRRYRPPEGFSDRRMASTVSARPANIFCMVGKAKIHPKDREFLQWVSSAAFVNPFSEERYELDLKIAGQFRNEAERAEFLTRAVSDRVLKLERQGHATLRCYDGGELELMRNVFLFEVFHHFYKKLDQVIVDQTKAGDDPVRVGFASDALALLARRGFSSVESLRFFGIFFQLRRAFFFIQRGLTGESGCMW